MKRFFPLLLVLLLLPCLIVPASASTQGVIDAIWDTHDELGEWLGVSLGDIIDRLWDIIDRLDWLDDAVRAVETELIKIGKQLFASAEYTIGTAVDRIRVYVYQINQKLDSLVSGESDKADDIVDDAPPLQTEIQDMEDVLATAPTIDGDSFDSAIDDAYSKYNGMNTQGTGNVLFTSLSQVATMPPLSYLIPTASMLAVVSFAVFGRIF